MSCTSSCDEKQTGETVTISAQGALLIPGQSSFEIPLLRRRLGLPAASQNEETYDAELKTAVEAFQTSRSLDVDGMIGPATRKALNASQTAGKQDKLKSIVATMEQ